MNARYRAGEHKQTPSWVLTISAPSTGKWKQRGAELNNYSPPQCILLPPPLLGFPTFLLFSWDGDEVLDLGRCATAASAVSRERESVCVCVGRESESLRTSNFYSMQLNFLLSFLFTLFFSSYSSSTHWFSLRQVQVKSSSPHFAPTPFYLYSFIFI